MNITEELNRLKQDIDGEGRWSAMDLFRFLGLSNWEKFKRIVQESKYVISTDTSTPIVLIKNKDVEDYVLNAQAAFELVMKVVNDGYERERGWRAQNYFVQYMYEHDRSQKNPEWTESGARKLSQVLDAVLPQGRVQYTSFKNKATNEERDQILAIHDQKNNELETQLMCLLESHNQLVSESSKMIQAHQQLVEHNATIIETAIRKVTEYRCNAEQVKKLI